MAHVEKIIWTVLHVTLALVSIEAGSTGNTVNGEGDFKLTILHVNDFHARFEETNVYSGRCTPKDKEKDRCYGGFARLKTAVDEERARSPNTIYLSGGDYFQGTIWYTVHKWKAMSHFLNLVPHDAMAFGNHEFDDGIDGENGVVNFLKAVNFPVLSANIVDDDEPEMKGLYTKSVVLEKGGRKIGIVGYLTTETLVISKPRHLGITDEVEAVRKEAKLLKEKGVDIIIALGHAGYSKDIDIAKEVEEVDVVVGGHTNTFLYTGEDPSTEVSVASYPSVITQASGRKVPVVQAYAFGKYLGRLRITFNAAGEVTGWDGNPILLNNQIKQNETILQELVSWRKEIEMQVRDEIGRTYVFLEGNRLVCRAKECNLGNLEADAIVHVNAKYPDDLNWAHTSLAILNGGGIRASIDERATNGSITMEDLLAVAPFQNTIDIVELRGSHVKEIFEHSVYNYKTDNLDLPGGFLQVSGFTVVYDINLPPGSRVVRLQARCQKCRVPQMEEVREEEIYKIAMPSFLASGGDGYSVIKNNKINHHLTGLLDTDAYVEYIKQVSPIYQGTENRILFIDTKNLCSGEAIIPSSATAYSIVSHSTSSESKESSGEEEEEEEDRDSDVDGGGNGGGRTCGLTSSFRVVMVVMVVVVWQCLLSSS